MRIHARPLIHHVSLVAADDSPPRLSSRSPTHLLDRQLDELALPEYGTKLDKWTRIQRRENELLLERKAHAADDAERKVGPDGRRMELAVPMVEPREPSSSRACDRWTRS